MGSRISNLSYVAEILLKGLTGKSDLTTLEETFPAQCYSNHDRNGGEKI
jgi:hypothetical protein